MSDPASAPGRTAAVVGVGFTPFTRASGKSVLSLATEAVADAIRDAGLRLGDVDGMNSFMVSDDSVPCVAVSSALGLGPLRTVLDVQLGGQAPCHLGLAGGPVGGPGRRRGGGRLPGPQRPLGARGSVPCGSPGWVGSTATRSGTAPT